MPGARVPQSGRQGIPGQGWRLTAEAFEKAVPRWQEAKEIAAEELSKIEGYPDCFVAGITPERPEQVPTHAVMAKVGQEFHKALASGAPVAIVNTNQPVDLAFRFAMGRRRVDPLTCPCTRSRWRIRHDPSPGEALLEQSEGRYPGHHQSRRPG